MHVRDKKDQIVDCVRRWGGSTSDAILDPLCEIFHLPEVDGLIGYRQSFRRAVVFGDPVCCPSKIPLIVSAFHDYCASKNLQPIYVSASQKFANWAIKNITASAIEFGEELSLNPHEDPREKKGEYPSLVRRKVKRALKEGASVEEYVGNDPKLEAEIVEMGKKWRADRKGLQIYISNIHLFENRPGKRWFYAKQNDRVIGILVLNEVRLHQGWHANHLMVVREAPNGTSELLIIKALETLRHENYNFMGFGSVVSAEPKLIGFYPFYSWVIPKMMKLAYRIFNVDTNKKFLSKFLPTAAPSYLVFTRKKFGLKDGLGLIRSMNVF